MTAELANSPVVRGLRVVRTNRWVRLPSAKPWVARVARLVSPQTDTGWSIVSVHRGPEIVARRGFVTDREADRVQGQFSAAVLALSDDQAERADWQELLDRIPPGPG